jgi:hypothetical protein
LINSVGSIGSIGRSYLWIAQLLMTDLYLHLTSQEILVLEEWQDADASVSKTVTLNS